MTARGFAWAAEHDGQAAELLVKHAGPGGPPRTDLDMVRESQAEMGRVRPGHLCEQCAATRYSHKSESAAGLCRLLESWPCLPLVKAATAGLLLRPPLADVPTPGWQHYLDGQARWGAMEEGRWSEFLAWLDTSGLLHDQVLFVLPCDSGGVGQHGCVVL